MNPKFNRNGHSSKRRPSKRVLTAKNEIRAARLINEFDEDDHDWQRERKLKVHNLHPPTSQVRTNKVSQVKQKKRQVNKLNQEDF
ncbi:hypothetical protein J7E38_19550 [Bacillus sp. ISL-35]|uniref:hypothetical protein n=1 Tax=Bacillus sp. ISL-35 TaxID=2819122 RepID=UPI001BEB9F14|nr:hypothetical protein [Bacillus sp. ISL-35]MBT2681189.1 hypothetical protein [Bacillus sp. ISL-35]MBT2706100.1 hypothetical protein [Chryseobacterium sp. ISL-80]